MMLIERYLYLLFWENIKIAIHKHDKVEVSYENTESESDLLLRVAYVISSGPYGCTTFIKTSYIDSGLE